MMPPIGRYSTSPCKASKENSFLPISDCVVIQGRELKRHPDSHNFGEVSQSLAAKKLGRFLFSGRPGPSLCEWRAIQSQFISCAALSCLSRSSTQTNKIDQRTRRTRSPPREMWPGTFSFQAIGGKSLPQYSARPYYFYFSQLRASPIRCDRM